MSLTRTRICLVLCCLLTVGALAPESRAEEQPKKPDFALRDVDGVTRRLSDQRGKWVVLEWVDFGCRPVIDLYGAPARKMQTLQQTFKSKGVVWFSISSAAAGQRGHLTAKQGKAELARLAAQPTALLLDATGAAGKQFRAQVAPEVRLISPRGDVVYSGAVESAGKEGPTRCLEMVLSAATSGRALPFASKPAQGCRIPYAASGATYNGPKAPDFTLKDSYGFARKLSDYRGKWVILEWVNYDCPYVKKHYDASYRSMQKLQQRSARYGIVWLSICSSAFGKEGHLSPAQANARMTRMGAKPTAYLHDPMGAVGRSYGAATTPDMRIISPEGTIEYAGGIDSVQSMRAADLPRSKNYVRMAIADIVAGKPIAVRRSTPYGCTVKY